MVKITAEDIQKLEENIKNIVVFSIVWSIGCSIDYDGRSKFNEKLKMLLAQKGFVLPNKLYYDYFYN